MNHCLRVTIRSQGVGRAAVARGIRSLGVRAIMMSNLVVQLMCQVRIMSMHSTTTASPKTMCFQTTMTMTTWSTLAIQPKTVATQPAQSPNFTRHLGRALTLGNSRIGADNTSCKTTTLQKVCSHSYRTLHDRTMSRST